MKVNDKVIDARLVDWINEDGFQRGLVAIEDLESGGLSTPPSCQSDTAFKLHSDRTGRTMLFEQTSCEWNDAEDVVGWFFTCKELELDVYVMNRESEIWPYGK